MSEKIGVNRIIKVAISEFLKGHIKEMIAELLYRINMRIVRRIDISYVTTDELGLPAGISCHYGDSGGPNLRSILDKINITPNDAVIDIGCGKGGALITLSKYPFKKLSGIDLSPELIKIAQTNFDKLGIQKIKLLCCDASNFSDLDEFNYIYMYHPFSCQIMEKVMINISNSLIRCPRDFNILYNSPKCHDTILRTSHFKHRASFDNFKGKKFFIYKHERDN